MSNNPRYVDWGIFGSPIDENTPADEAQYPASAGESVWELKITVGKMLIETEPTDTPEQISAAIQAAHDMNARREKSEAVSQINAGSKRDALSAVIARAMSEATDHQDLHSVWAVLLASAQRKDPNPPLLGVTDDGSCIRYRTSNNTVSLFTIRMLRERLKRKEKSRKVP